MAIWGGAPYCFATGFPPCDDWVCGAWGVALAGAEVGVAGVAPAPHPAATARVSSRKGTRARGKIRFIWHAPPPKIIAGSGKTSDELRVMSDDWGDETGPGLPGPAWNGAPLLPLAPGGGALPGSDLGRRLVRLGEPPGRHHLG